MLISVDPGLNHCAVALWTEEGELARALLIRNPSAKDKKLPRPEIWSAGGSAVVRKISSFSYLVAHLDPIKIAIEIPVVRQRGSGKGDPNDLIDVAGVAASFVQAAKNGLGAVVVWAPKPEEWKGQLPKAVTQERVEAKLSDVEKTRIENPGPGLMHNIYDAIHLGLVHLKRA